jgi:hypothetical protein
MTIYREMLEHSAEIIELAEDHYKKVSLPNISIDRQNKYKEFMKHVQGLIKNLQDDLHILLRIDNELKILEEGENEN